MGQLLGILYRSEALTRAKGADDRALLKIARERNEKLDITGFLHRESDVFYQWLEGPEDAVRAVFASICHDNRHHHLQKVAEQPIAQRSFAQWSMGYSNDDTNSLFDWAAIKGISLHPVRTADVLAFMRTNLTPGKAAK